MSPVSVLSLACFVPWFVALPNPACFAYCWPISNFPSRLFDLSLCFLACGFRSSPKSQADISEATLSLSGISPSILPARHDGLTSTHQSHPGLQLADHHSPTHDKFRATLMLPSPLDTSLFSHHVFFSSGPTLWSPLLLAPLAPSYSHVSCRIVQLMSSYSEVASTTEAAVPAIKETPRVFLLASNFFLRVLLQAKQAPR